jgi:pimeloyl-ACP methyl ester carboxylesterase
MRIITTGVQPARGGFGEEPVGAFAADRCAEERASRTFRKRSSGGEQDGIVPLEYGRALADSFPHATFRPIPEAGHFPHIEQPGSVFGAIGDFVDTEVKPDGE